MVSLAANIQRQANQAYHWAEEVGISIQQGMQNRIHKIHVTVTHASQSVQSGCQNAVQSVKQKSQAAAQKVNDFVYRNKETIFFVGCCSVTAFLLLTCFSLWLLRPLFYELSSRVT